MSPHFFRRQVVGDRSLVTYAAGYLLLLLSCCVTAAVQRWRIIAAMLTSFCIQRIMEHVVKATHLN